MLANISESNAAKKCIHYCMNKNVAVGMCDRADVVGNHDAAENEFPSRAKAVDVVTVAYLFARY